MKYLSMMIGAAITGALVFGLWPEMWKSYGIMGGWLASVLLVGLCWFMNHWLNLFGNPDDRVWVDQGLAMWPAGIAWAMTRFGANFNDCLPTLFLVALGGALGGIAAYYVKQHNPNFQPKEPGV